MIGRRLVLVATAAVMLAGGTAVAVAQGVNGPPTTPPSATPPKAVGTLAAHHPLLTFGASLGNNNPIPLVNNPIPVVCAVHCQEYTFTDRAPGIPFLVALKSTITGPHGTFNADNGYDLYVYDPSGRLAGSANGIGANGQAVQIDNPAKGRYTIVVTITYVYDENSGYRGEVRLIAGRTWRPASPTCGIRVSGITGCFNLPRIRALPAYDLTTTGVPPAPSTPLGFPFPFNLPTDSSCYSDETIGIDNTTVTNANDPTLRCLRFTSDIQNVGAGPLTADIPAAATGPDGALEVGYLPGGCRAEQIVYLTNGRTVSRPAGSCEFHVEHGHFHYAYLLTYALYKASRNGAPAGRVVGSTKASFCLTDDDYFGYGSTGPNGPRRNVGQPDCNLPRQGAVPIPGQPNSGTYIEEGITPGWGDVYTWDTPGQFINVTHVPSGVYDIVEETNPNGTILVAGPLHTCAMTELRLTVGASADTATVLGAKASVACPRGLYTTRR